MAFFFDENFLQLFSNTCRCKSFKVSTNGWNGMLDNFLFYDTVMSFATTAGLPAWCIEYRGCLSVGGFAAIRIHHPDVRLFAGRNDRGPSFCLDWTTSAAVVLRTPCTVHS